MEVADYLHRGAGAGRVSHGCADGTVRGALTRRHSGLDLQRELVQGVFIHHQRLVQQELGHLEGRESGRFNPYSPLCFAFNKT